MMCLLHFLEINPRKYKKCSKLVSDFDNVYSMILRTSHTLHGGVVTDRSSSKSVSQIGNLSFNSLVEGLLFKDMEAQSFDSSPEF